MATPHERELVRRQLQLEIEIARHELECLIEDGADDGKIRAKIDECELIMERQHWMAVSDAQRDALRHQWKGTVTSR